MSKAKKIHARDLRELGYEPGAALNHAMRQGRRALRWGMERDEVLRALAGVRHDPSSWITDPNFGEVARALGAEPEPPVPCAPESPLREGALPCATWGVEGIDPNALQQMDNACRLPITVKAALMPDAHQGYGVPIGGVVATRDAVIPYAVGVDIACRMRLTVVDLPPQDLERVRERLRRALQTETAFGVGSHFERNKRRSHEVLDDPAWERLDRTMRAKLHPLACAQLGTSGSGNHFVEWGELDVREPVGGLKPGRHIALLSHSGSRGVGAKIADHFTRVAMAACPLPKSMRHLAWLDLKSDAGEAYWNAMNLAGRFAQANHECIHRHVVEAAGLEAVFSVENHHNFAWIEEHGGERLVVHRKGATPAGEGALGVIPGSMATPGFLVRGRGEARSLNSASHGAGRRMSRRAAKETISKHEWDAALAEAQVELLAGGRDEAPQAYKPIEEVMAAQSDLVEILAEFHPRLVLMSAEKHGRDI